MSSENTDLCNNPFVALFGSVTQVEQYKTSIEDATKCGTYIIKSCIVSRNFIFNICDLCFLSSMIWQYW